MAETEQDETPQAADQDEDTSRREAQRRREEQRAHDRERAKASRQRLVRWVASGVSILAAVFAIVLALHIVFVVFSANDGNPVVSFVADFANGIVWFFRDMFTPEDPRVQVLVNFGMAAVFWLIAGRIASALIRRIP